MGSLALLGRALIRLNCMRSLALLGRALSKITRPNRGDHVVNHVDQLATRERTELLAVQQAFERLRDWDSPFIIQKDDDGLGWHCLGGQIWVGFVEKPVQPIQQAHEFVLREVQNGVVIDLFDDPLELDDAEDLVRRGLCRTCGRPLTDPVEEICVVCEVVEPHQDFVKGLCGLPTVHKPLEGGAWTAQEVQTGLNGCIDGCIQFLVVEPGRPKVELVKLREYALQLWRGCIEPWVRCTQCPLLIEPPLRLGLEKGPVRRMNIRVCQNGCERCAGLTRVESLLELLANTVNLFLEHGGKLRTYPNNAASTGERRSTGTTLATLPSPDFGA